MDLVGIDSQHNWQRNVAFDENRTPSDICRQSSRSSAVKIKRHIELKAGMRKPFGKALQCEEVNAANQDHDIAILVNPYHGTPGHKSCIDTEGWLSTRSSKSG